MTSNKEDYNDGYYHVGKDLEDYPDAWLIVVWSPRGPGKTYSALWYREWNNIPIVYMKRTIDDVKLLCDGDGKDEFDKSPYKPINRDKGTNIHARYIEKGIGGFYRCDPEGEPAGPPCSYIAALNAIKSIKGFDMSECQWMLLDEFIPQTGEIVRHAEGAMLLDVYMTIARDREKRGLPPLKLILFANAEQISTPITNELEIVDDMADLAASGKSHMYLEERGILLHHITREEIPLRDSEKSGIYKAMKHTAWGRKALEGEFANNDFSNIKKVSIKGMKPYLHIKHKSYDWYIYFKDDGLFYMCSSPAKCLKEYDLNLENDQKLFFYDEQIDLRNRCMEGHMLFQKYSMYDLIMNYKKFFNL